MAIAAKPWFSPVLSFVFIIDAAAALISILSVWSTYFNGGGPPAEGGQLYSTGLFMASVIVAGFVVAGALIIKTSRLRAYIWFRRALLVNIFLKQPFLFYDDQFRAVFGLALYLIGLTALNYMINREKKR